MERQLRRDLRTLATFVTIYCDAKHPEAGKAPVTMRTIDLAAISRRPIALCPDCQKLLLHALTKRLNCPMAPKPACKHCPNHCYHPTYRSQIREVMQYSGKRLVLSGRLDYLLHLLF